MAPVSFLCCLKLLAASVLCTSLRAADHDRSRANAFLPIYYNLKYGFQCRYK